jgi:hypothetical protein
VNGFAAETMERCLACEADAVGAVEGSRFGLPAMTHVIISVICAAGTCGNRWLPGTTWRDLLHSNSVSR